MKVSTIISHPQIPIMAKEINLKTAKHYQGQKNEKSTLDL